MQTPIYVDDFPITRKILGNGAKHFKLFAKYGVMYFLGFFHPLYLHEEGLTFRRPRNPSVAWIRGFNSVLFGNWRKHNVKYFASPQQLKSLQIYGVNEVNIDISDDEKSLSIKLGSYEILNIKRIGKLIFEAVDRCPIEKMFHDFRYECDFAHIHPSVRYSNDPIVCGTIYITKHCPSLQSVRQKDVIYLLRCGITYEKLLEIQKNL